MALSLLPSEEKVQILLDDVENRETSIFFDQHKNIIRLPIYSQRESGISGIVRLNFEGKSLKHNGIFIQLVGETQNYHKQDHPDLFLMQTQELEAPGKHKGQLDYAFSFANFDRKYETYYGIAGRIRYYLKAVIVRGELSSPITATCEFAVQLPVLGTLFNQSFEIQLRIADYLMIDVDLNKTSLHVNECLIGKITVGQIKLFIKKIQVSIVKREITNPTEEITCTKEDIVCKKELLSKCPKKGDIIPFKINLGALDISPNLLQSNSKMLIKYILILSFIDEDERSLFKPIDLNIWRKQ